jgi:hypothetical protein
VKLNETDPEKTSHRATFEEVKEKANNTLKNHPEKPPGSDTIENASHRCETTPSGDLTLLTPDKQRTEHLIAH